MGNTEDTEARLFQLFAERDAMSQPDHLRHHRAHEHLNGAFGGDKFGKNAEKFARFFGTPKFIVIQTLIVALWIVLNIVGLTHHWDPYPFILLNLMFSTQAAYAAPLILLAQTRQADRDKATAEADAKHREEISSRQLEGIQADTEISSQVLQLQNQQMSTLALLNKISARLGCDERETDGHDGDTDSPGDPGTGVLGPDGIPHS
jgi:uncharacterized membrane protein